jgi:hypothetical protein
MTEAEWNACGDPATMLIFVKSKATARKLRLFVVACCRKISFCLKDERSHCSIGVAERYADGNASEAERESALEAVEYVVDAAASDLVASALWYPNSLDNAVYTADDTSSTAACIHATASTDQRYGGEEWQRQYAIGRSSQAALLRCIFGPLPFRPVIADPAWLTTTVANLAQAIYADRAFDRLPILADALEDAGCTDADILAHCRGGGEHVRGSWAVDLLLNKE